MKLVLILAAALLAGCSSLSQSLENRLACAVAGDKAFTVSQYGPVGISSTIAAADTAVVCRRP